MDVFLEQVLRLPDKNLRDIISGVSAGVMSGRIFVSMDATTFIGARIVEHLITVRFCFEFFVTC